MRKSHGIKARESEQRQQIADARHGNAHRKRTELPDPSREHRGTHEVADSGAYERAEHLDRTATKEKYEGTACGAGSKPLLNGTIVWPRPLNGRKHLVVLVHREVSAIRLNLAQEVLHHPDAVRVHSRCGQAHDLVENMMSLDARAFERQQAQVHVNGDAKDTRHAIHRVAHAPGARSAREHEHASAANDRGLVSKWGGDGGRVSLGHDIAPDGLHVQRVCSHAVMVKQRVTQGVGSQSGLRPGCAKTSVLVFVLVFVLDKIEVLDGLDHSMAWLVIDVILILLVKEVEALQDLLALAVIIGSMLTESLHPCLPSGVARLPPPHRSHSAAILELRYVKLQTSI